MAEALGVRAVETPVEEVRQRNPDLAAMYEFLASEGYAIDVTALRGRYSEVAWSSFGAWATSLNRETW